MFLSTSRLLSLPVKDISSVLSVLLLLSFAGCNKQVEPEVVSISDDEASKHATQIRNETSVKLAEGLDLNLWASEKLLADPIGLDITNQGEAYVSVTNRRSSSKPDIRSHPDWRIESISWDHVDDRKAFLDEKLAPERSDTNSSWLQDLNNDSSHDWKDLTVNKEEIFRITDKSNDGLADRSQLYLRDFHQKETDVAGTVLSHDGNVFVGAGPDLWSTSDTNNDGVADIKTSLSHGYVIHIGFRGHGMSGLTLGPDGRIYWSVGDVGLNVEGPDGKTWAYPNQGAILRSDPDGNNFEVFAAGLRNPHEFSFDKYGNLITVDHDGDHAGEQERLAYIINRSDSGWRTHWQFGKYSDPKNNDYKVWMDEGYHKPHFQKQSAHILPPLASYHNGVAGMAYNPGTALTDEWDDHFFISDFTGSPATSAIHSFELEPQGASFQLKNDHPIMQGILPTGIDFGPDGSLYFTDWIEGWNTNDKGRIWRIDAAGEEQSKIRKQTQQILGSDFSSIATDSLSRLLHHQDMRVRMEAQFELAQRGSKQALSDAIKQKKHQLARVHGIWGIGQIARDNTSKAEPLVTYLQDTDSRIRAQAAKILGDVRYKPSAEALIPLLQDSSLRVQLFAAQALGRISYGPATQPIINMLQANDDNDIYLRQGGAIALARIGNEEALGQLADHPSEAVRIAAVVALKRLESPEVAHFLDDKSKFIVTNAARAINDDAFIEEALPDLARMTEQKRFTNPPLMRRAINASLFNGTTADANRLAAFSNRQGVSDSLRAEALATLSIWHEPSTLDRVTGRYRGEIHNDKEAATKAISSVIEPILSNDKMLVQRALIEAISSLQMDDVAPRLFAVLESSAEADVKIAALNALQNLKYSNMQQAVETALASDDRNLRMKALSLTPSLGITDREKATLLSSVLNGGSTVEQQSAIKALGSMNSKRSNDILQEQFSKLLDGSLPKEIQLELIHAADSSDTPKLKEMLAQYKETKPEDDVVAQYREALWGGNAEKGAEIFYNDNAAQCIRCHAVGGEGGNIGPDLATIGEKLSREQLLEALVTPNKRIAPGFGSVTITTQDGQKVTGLLQEETETSLTIQNGDGETSQIAKDQIANQTSSPSAMYSMADILSKSELRDLVEFLNKLRE
jgi:putative membrane-bound dehydrogenase-like protein